VCDDNICTDLATLDNCDGCGDPCPAGLADACVSGRCRCGANRFCDHKIADACASGACQCGEDPACATETELCLSGSCLSGDCVLVSGAAMCVVDTELNVYQLSPGSHIASGECTSSSECASFMLGCGSGWTCFCGAFLRTQPDGPPTSRGKCDAYLTENLIV